MAITKLERAVKIYKHLCNVLDTNGLKFDKDEDELTLHFGIGGDSDQIIMIMRVNAKKQVLSIYSPMPYNIVEDKRIEGAIASTHATYKLALGSFDYNMANGRISYRLTQSFIETELSEELILSLLSYSHEAVKRHNHLFREISEGKLEVTKFIADLA